MSVPYNRQKLGWYLIHIVVVSISNKHWLLVHIVRKCSIKYHQRKSFPNLNLGSFSEILTWAPVKTEILYKQPPSSSSSSSPVCWSGVESHLRGRLDIKCGMKEPSPTTESHLPIISAWWTSRGQRRQKSKRAACSTAVSSDCLWRAAWPCRWWRRAGRPSSQSPSPGVRQRSSQIHLNSLLRFNVNTLFISHSSYFTAWTISFWNICFQCPVCQL